MKKYFWMSLMTTVLFACKDENMQEYTQQKKGTPVEEPKTAKTHDFKPIYQKYTTEQMVSKIIKGDLVKDKEVKKILSESVYDAEMVKTLTYLTEIAEGEMIYAEDSKKVIASIVKLLDKHAIDNTDVTFIIDRTSSMMDDIEETKKNIDLIMSRLAQLQNVRVSVATYGDRNFDGKTWYRSLGLTNNFEMVKDFIKDIELTDGGDYPESVNDAIYRLVTENNWSFNSNKMVIVLGDAPSHTKPFSMVDIEDVVRLCKSKNILINFYPIIIATEVSKSPGTGNLEESSFEVTGIINKVKINYARDVCNIDLKYGSAFKMELYSIRGEKLREIKFFGSSYELDLRNYNNGSYVLRFIDEQNKQLDGQFFNIERKNGAR